VGAEPVQPTLPRAAVVVDPARRVLELGRTELARAGALDLGEPFFPAARGGWQRRSNYGRYIWDNAAADVGWPRQDNGRWLWTFHSLRNVFATWALHEARIPIEDLSRLMGHSSTRVTQDIYVHVRDDMFDRFFQATAQRPSTSRPQRSLQAPPPPA
jgi:integrase